MKKIVRLTESDLNRIVKKVIHESLLSQFSEKELLGIKNRVIRLMNPGFFDENEVVFFLEDITGGDKRTLKSLVSWLEENGVDFGYYKRWILGGDDDDEPLN